MKNPTKLPWPSRSTWISTLWGQGILCHNLVVTIIARWWFQISIIFTPIPGEMIQFDKHSFQMGWFNHQPERPSVPRKLPNKKSIVFFRKMFKRREPSSFKENVQKNFGSEAPFKTSKDDRASHCHRSMFRQMMMVVFLNSTMIHQQEGKIRVSGLSDVGGAPKNWADVSKHPRGGGVKTQVTQPQVQLTQMPSDHPSDSIPMAMENEPFQVQEINQKCPSYSSLLWGVLLPKMPICTENPSRNPPWIRSVPWVIFCCWKMAEIRCVVPLLKGHPMGSPSDPKETEAQKLSLDFQLLGVSSVRDWMHQLQLFFSEQERPIVWSYKIGPYQW